MFAVQNKINFQIVLLDLMFYGAKRKFWNNVCAKHFGTISVPNDHFGTIFEPNEHFGTIFVPNQTSIVVLVDTNILEQSLC